MFYNDLKQSNKLSLVLGLNVLDDDCVIQEVCSELKSIQTSFDINFIFKASWDKANRSSIHSYRGKGLNEGRRLFELIKKDFSFEILTDVHEIGQAKELSSVVDVFQLPAFLSRQTDLVIDLALAGKPVNIKKAQFLAPDQMIHITDKFKEAGNSQLILCERGHSFGYNNLVVDFLGVDSLIRKSGYPVLLDVTHSLQIRREAEAASGGRADQARTLALAAVAAGINGLFIETHPNPSLAKCDGPSATKLSDLRKLVSECVELYKLMKSF